MLHATAVCRFRMGNALLVDVLLCTCICFSRWDMPAIVNSSWTIRVSFLNHSSEVKNACLTLSISDVKALVETVQD